MNEQKLAALQDWGMSDVDAEIVAKAIAEKKKIVITGRVGTGKTKLLNELIRVADPQQKFEYRAIEKVSEYSVEPDNQKKIAGEAEIADYIVADEAPLSLEYYLNQPQALIATKILTSVQQIHQFDCNVAPMADLIITLDAYKKVWNVRQITIHDRLLHSSLGKLKGIEEECKARYAPFPPPYEQVRIEWLEQLDEAESAAVQLGHMNRAMENSGLSGWYQGDGAILQQDIPSLLKWAALGTDQGIEGFNNLAKWLVSVRDQYLPAAQANSSSDDPECEQNLNIAYFQWSDRMERFDDLLTNLAGQGKSRCQPEMEG